MAGKPPKMNPRFVAGVIVHAIEQDINRRSGITPLVWNVPDQRQILLEEWTKVITGIIEKHA